MAVILRYFSEFAYRLHDTTGFETGLTAGLTTGCIVYTNIQPVLHRVNGV